MNVMKRTLIQSLLFSSMLGLCTTSLAGNGPGDLSPEQPPIDDNFISHTVAIGSTLVANQAATEYSYQSVDGEGNLYTAYINTVTGEVSASSSDTVIANVLSPSQMTAVQNKYTAGGSPPTASALPLVVVPLAIALMCYVNDNITKERQNRHCERSGQTVVYDNTGVCGQWASYRCEYNPVPRPAPQPLPTPTPPTHGYWTLPDSTNISSQFQLVVNMHDSDWFGP